MLPGDMCGYPLSRSRAHAVSGDEVVFYPVPRGFISDFTAIIREGASRSIL